MDFKSQLIEYMNNGITIKHLMHYAGASKSTVERWIQGINEPHPTMQYALFDKLDLLFKYSVNKDNIK